MQEEGLTWDIKPTELYWNELLECQKIKLYGVQIILLCHQANIF